MGQGRIRQARPIDKPDTTSPTALFFNQAVEKVRSYKTQADIAEECGFFSSNGQPMSNIVTMFKQGRSRIPIDKIMLVAKAVDADPIKLFEIAYKEYYPDNYEIIEMIISKKVDQIVEHKMKQK